MDTLRAGSCIVFSLAMGPWRLVWGPWCTSGGGCRLPAASAWLCPWHLLPAPQDCPIFRCRAPCSSANMLLCLTGAWGGEAMSTASGLCQEQGWVGARPTNIPAAQHCWDLGISILKMGWSQDQRDKLATLFMYPWSQQHFSQAQLTISKPWGVIFNSCRLFFFSLQYAIYFAVFSE